ncbi:hypothetical protein WA026_014843, partial [Henosepilachna vigintioctopunctata]
ISICSSEVNLTIAALNAASDLHRIFLGNILRQPIQFFDCVPVGRVLSRFSKDIRSVDEELPFNCYEVVESSCIVSDNQCLNQYPNLKQLCLALALILGSLSLAKGYTDASIFIHANLLSNVFHQAMSFFDTTPTGFASVIAEYGVHLGGLTGAKLIHEKLLHNMLRVSLAFYDTTPLGRILSRFSKDVEIMDDTLPWNFSELISCFME